MTHKPTLPKKLIANYDFRPEHRWKVSHVITTEMMESNLRLQLIDYRSWCSVIISMLDFPSNLFSICFRKTKRTLAEKLISFIHRSFGMNWLRLGLALCEVDPVDKDTLKVSKFVGGFALKLTKHRLETHMGVKRLDNRPSAMFIRREVNSASKMRSSFSAQQTTFSTAEQMLFSHLIRFMLLVENFCQTAQHSQS